MTTSVIALALSMATVGVGKPNPNPWNLANDEDGIKVWTRDVPGARVREVRAETTVNAPSKRVFDVLGDVQHYVDFMPYVVETRIIGEAKDGHYEYQRIDPPIVDMRDYCVKVTIEADEASGVYIRSWEPANDKAPPKREGTVRVEVNSGSWTLEPLAGGKTHVSYYLYTDPGGSIPAWIANKANTTSLPDLLNAVKNRSLNPKWKRD